MFSGEVMFYCKYILSIVLNLDRTKWSVDVRGHHLPVKSGAWLSDAGLTNQRASYDGRQERSVKNVLE